MLRSGLTVIELLIILVIILIVGSLIFAGVGGGGFLSETFDGKVVEKWTDVDWEGGKIYRVQVMKPDGEVDTWDSWWVHNKVQKGTWYKFKTLSGQISGVENTPQRVEVENGH